MGNPNARGNKRAASAALKAPKKPAPFNQKPIPTGPAKPWPPKVIDIAVKIPTPPDQEIGQDIVAQAVPRGALLRFSAAARGATKDKPDTRTFVIDGKIYTQALLALVDWMQNNVHVEKPARVEVPQGITPTFEKTVMLFSISQILGIPRRFTEHLRTQILRYLDVPLTREQVQLVWETMNSDAGIVNLLAKKLVELKLDGLYNESAQAAIREYVLTQPRLNKALSAHMNNIQGLNAEREKAHQEYLQRQAKREKEAARYGVNVADLPEYREKQKEKARLRKEMRQEWKENRIAGARRRRLAAKDGQRSLSDFEVACMMGRNEGKDK